MDIKGNGSTGIEKLPTSKCVELLGENYIGRLAFIVDRKPYISPITYFHDVEDKSILSYSAPGYKMEAMKRHEFVSLQVDDIRSIFRWRSVLVQGKFEPLEGSTAKKYLHRFAEGVQSIIMKKEPDTPKFIKDFSSRVQERGIPIVYRIRITDIVGKFRED